MTRPASLEVALIAPATVSTLLVAVALPSEATAIEWEISLVATSCSSTAEAIACMKLSISRTASLISLIAVTLDRVDACTAETCSLISAVALAVWPASVFTSCSDDGETLSGLASPGRFDGRVESQEIGLLGYCVDHLNDGADPFSSVGKTGNLVIRPLCGLGRTHDHIRRTLRLLGNFTNGSRKFLRGCGNGLYF